MYAAPLPQLAACKTLGTSKLSLSKGFATKELQITALFRRQGLVIDRCEDACTS